ncbi:MAG: AAA family ATPase [gamma proteobacterium symbiont of Taylorina sp.]|nr:AAA family ATPase [gamma proteobacterium symbiont of Taylorina sp.]
MLSKLDLSGRIVALVGSNEAGKSSILKAITYIYPIFK